MNPFFREARVVDDERFDARQPPIKFEREPTEKLRVRPATLRDAPEQALPHRLDLTLVIHQPRRHRLDALAVTVEEQPGHVSAHRRAPLGPAHLVGHRVEELAELSVQPRQLSSIHINRRSKTEIHVNRNRPSSVSARAELSHGSYPVRTGEAKAAAI